MKNKEFLKQLTALLSKGEIVSEEVLGNTGGSIGTVPRIFGTIDGYLVKFDFVSYKEVKLEVDMKPQHYLYLRHFSKFSNLLKKLKIARDVKISKEEFNQKYYLRNVESDVAERTLSCLSSISWFHC